MGDTKSADTIKGEDGGEARLRGGSLLDDEKNTNVDRAAQQQGQGTDDVIRTDDEEDTLYDDGLEIDSNSRPLTGINGKDDSR